MNYITAPKLYNTGYLSDDSYSRVKQGLMPQILSSDCYVSSSIGNHYNYIPKNYVSSNSTYNTSFKPLNNRHNNNIFLPAYKLATQSTQEKLYKPEINQNILYPIHNNYVYYGNYLPNDAPCMDYIQSP